MGIEKQVLWVHHITRHCRSASGVFHDVYQVVSHEEWGGGFIS